MPLAHLQMPSALASTGPVMVTDINPWPEPRILSPPRFSVMPGNKAAINENVVRGNSRFGIRAQDRPGVKGSNRARGNNSGKRQCMPERLC